MERRDFFKLALLGVGAHLARPLLQIAPEPMTASLWMKDLMIGVSRQSALMLDNVGIRIDLRTVTEGIETLEGRQVAVLNEVLMHPNVWHEVKSWPS